MTAFTDKTLLITGGTGSFGHTVLKHFLTSDIGEIRIFSRDEKKQDDMRHELQASCPDVASKVRFYIGDVRNAQSVRDAMHDVDYIFHAAALKQVPSCEFFPMEAVRTNVIGTDNVLHAAIDAGQSSLPHQRDGNVESDDGKDHLRQRSQWGWAYDHLLHTLWQCDVQPRQCHSSFYGTD